MSESEFSHAEWGALEWAARQTEVERGLAWVQAYGLERGAGADAGDVQGAGLVAAALSAAARVLKDIEPQASRSRMHRGSAAAARGASPL